MQWMRIVFPLNIIVGDKWFFFSPSSVNEIGSRRNNLRLDFLIFRGLYSGCAAVLGYYEITLLSNYLGWRLFKRFSFRLL